jgi:hypothetical protein
MPVRSGARFLLTCLMALTTGGCSWIIVRGPPENHAALDSFSCTESRIPPTMDVVWGSAYLGLSILNQAMSENINRVVSAAFGIGITAVAGASAYSGFSKTSECRKAYRELERRRQEGLPQLESPLFPSAAAPWALPVDSLLRR